MPIENSIIEGLLNDIIEQQTLINNFFSSVKIKFTIEGGLAIRIINKTGSPSVKGELVRADSGSELGFILTAGDDTECIGAVYEAGVADGSECWIGVGGIIEVLLKDSTASAPQNWAATSDVAGRADVSATSPAAAPTHFQEIGHGLVTDAGGTDKLVKIDMHFN